MDRLKKRKSWATDPLLPLGVELNYEGMEEELTCPVCLELYADPLMLPCSHSICKKCLNDIADRRQNTEKHDGVECPSCRRVVTVVGGDVSSLPRNLALENIVIRYTEERSRSIRKSLSLDSPVSDLLLPPTLPPTLQEDDESMAEFPSNSQTDCELCEQQGAAPAAWFCLQCEVAYCHACFAKYHPRKGALARHKIRQPDEDRQDCKTLYCEDHEIEPANIFCDTCKVLICSLCVCEGDGKHSGHKVLALDTASKKIKECVAECEKNSQDMTSTLNEQRDKINALHMDVKALHQDMKSQLEVQFHRMVSDITSALRLECDKALTRLNSRVNTFQEEAQKYLNTSENFSVNLQDLTKMCNDFSDVKGIHASLSRAAEVEPLQSTLSSAQQKSAKITSQYDKILKEKPTTQELKCQLEQFRTSAVNVVRAMFDDTAEQCECIIPMIRSPSSPGIPDLQPRVQNKFLTTWGFSSSSFTGEELTTPAAWTVTIERNSGHWGNFNTGYLFGVGLSSEPLGLKDLVGMNDKSHGVICTGGSVAFCHNGTQEHLLTLDSLPVTVTLAVSMDKDGYCMICYKVATSGSQESLLVGRRLIPKVKFQGHHYPVFTVSKRVKLLFPTFV